ncbi:uncharacterized protein F5891DRAFT_1186457 [Suillus fuscotomentosus]|uniref:Uncharacterized protein n=1 Tax=Suillus fuscotomentosus TaxID=1912939 RepID=A0AAD4ECA5_9AGAM|nr:uncharacterized protein F5891DRAFT_1186457 [Suillus fuscotomentosus]KAG1902359.1 hypothetical protein F5891DRAFT_1186457 [Suillus fuscotomentosus]
MTSTIPFPTSGTPGTSGIMSELQPADLKHSELSMVTCNPLTYQVCDFVYDNSPSTSFLDTAELFYETRAGYHHVLIYCNTDATKSYENPLITATSRTLIADIHALVRQFSIVDIPKPSKIFSALLPRVFIKESVNSDPWFRVLRIWSEIEEFNESESFGPSPSLYLQNSLLTILTDGHKRSIVEHTLNILLFPDLHMGFKIPKSLSLRTTGSTPASETIHELSLVTPSLPVPGTPFAVPSPLHLQLHVITCLSFNEQGRITYHRDVWDMRDVIGLVPGMRIAQWILGRAGAWGLSWIAKRLRSQPHSTSLITSAETIV